MWKLVSLAIALGFVSISPLSAANETTINVPISFRIPEPPACEFPCNEELPIPSFIKELNVLGPQGSLKTDLDKAAFFTRLERWREHAEVYRRSAERQLQTAEDWREEQVQLLIKLAYYDELLAGYKNAHRMRERDAITYAQAEE